MPKKDLNVGLIGHGFMGRTHSNAFLQAGRFFDLSYRPALKAVCGRNRERAAQFAVQLCRGLNRAWMRGMHAGFVLDGHDATGLAAELLATAAAKGKA